MRASSASEKSIEALIGVLESPWVRFDFDLLTPPYEENKSRRRPVPNTKM